MTRALSSGHLCLGVILGILVSLVGIQASFFWGSDSSSSGEHGDINVLQPIPNQRYGEVPMEFEIKVQQEDYIGMNSKYLYLIVDVLKLYKCNPETDASVAHIDYVLHSLFSEVNLFLNEKLSKYMDRADMARPGFSKFFMEASEREYGNAKALMDYINKRGGQLDFYTIPTPVRTTWTDGLEAVTDSLNVQKEIQKEILGVHTQAEAAGDPHLSQILEGNFMDQNTELIKKLADYVAQLERLKKDKNWSLGEYVFEQNLK